MEQMIEEKIQQAMEIMKELNVDAWLTFVRESESVFDPSLDMVAGCNVTWQSAFLLNTEGKRIAIVGSLDTCHETGNKCSPAAVHVRVNI